jgi:hypothetical protein
VGKYRHGTQCNLRNQKDDDMRILTANEYGLVGGGLYPIDGDGGGGGGYYDASDFGGEISDFYQYGGTACSDFSDYGGASASNAGFVDYMASNVDSTAALTGLGIAVGSALNTGIAQYGALAATGEAVTADVAAAAAGVGAAYGGGVTIAAAAGWQIGTWIYNKYSIQIGDGIDSTVNFIQRHH